MEIIQIERWNWQNLKVEKKKPQFSSLAPYNGAQKWIFNEITKNVLKIFFSKTDIKS